MPRSIELLLVLLLVAFTAGVVLQVKNQRLLNDILLELRQREPVAASGAPTTPTKPATPPANTNTGTPPKVVIVEPAKPSTPPTTPVDPPVTPTDPPNTPTPPVVVDPPAESPDPATPIAAVDTADDSPQWRQHGQVVQSVIVQLFSGAYDEVIKRLDPPMKASLNRDQLAAAFDEIAQKHGGLKRLIDHRVVLEGTTASMTVFAVDAELADGFVQSLTIWIDNQQRIGGLLLGKSGGAG